MGDRGGEVSDENQNESTGIDFYTFQLDYSSFLDSSSCFFPRRSYPTVCGRSSGEPPAPSARQPSMRLRLRGRPWFKAWTIWRSPNAGALTTRALFSQLKHELSKEIWNCTREWHQGLTPERDTREWIHLTSKILDESKTASRPSLNLMTMTLIKCQLWIKVSLLAFHLHTLWIHLPPSQ